MTSDADPKISEVFDAASDGADKAYWNATSDADESAAKLMREIFKAIALIYRAQGK